MLRVAIRACPGCSPRFRVGSRREVPQRSDLRSLKPRPDETACALILEPSEGARVAPGEW